MTGVQTCALPISVINGTGGFVSASGTLINTHTATVASMPNIGDTVVIVLECQDLGQIYRITAVTTQSGAGHGSIIVEQIL